MNASPEAPAPPARWPLSYGLATSVAEVERLTPAWEAVLERSSCHRAFSSPAWFLASCGAAPGVEPRVATAWRGGELAGVLPAAQAPGSREARFPTLFGDYNDLVVPAEDAAAAAGLLAFATTAPLPYDGLVLRQLRPDSNCLLGLAALASREVGSPLGETDTTPGPDPGRRRGGSRWNCFYVRLPASFDAYLAGRSARFRKALRHAERRAAEGGVAVRALDPGEVAAARVPEIFLALHRSRFGTRSVFAPPAAERFVHAVVPELFARRRLLALALVHGQTPIALDLCLRGADSLGTWNGGFLPEAAAWSPGWLLAAAGIRAGLAMGCREFDWLRGEQPYKARWATHQRTLEDVELPVVA